MEPTKYTHENLLKVLFDFVERASQKGATPEEVIALPEVARMILDQMRSL